MHKDIEERRRYRRDYMKQYYATNLEQREKARERLKIWRQNNKEIMSIQHRIYMKRESVKKRKRERDKKRNDIISMNDRTITQKSLLLLLKYQNHRCNLCNIKLNKVVKHLDHIMPLSK